MAKKKSLEFDLLRKCSPSEHNYEPTDTVDATSGGRVKRLYVCSKCGDSYWN